MNTMIVLVIITGVYVCFKILRSIAMAASSMIRQPPGKSGGRLFTHNYLDSTTFYVDRFREIPNTTYVTNIDVSKSLELMQEKYRSLIQDTYQSCFFNRQAGKQEFHKTVIVLYNKVVVELVDAEAHLLYTQHTYAFAGQLLTEFNDFQLPEKKKDHEINIITLSNQGLELKRLDIKPTVLDIQAYYNDDFEEVDAIIREQLSESNDKGIILLHGLPGTGKTTYLRHLIGELDKKVLFVSPSVAANLMNPEFIDLLLDNPNAVLIIEDAENILMDRKFNTDSSVSNLLNLSDGLLSDCLGVQIICTFNNTLELIDPALMRKGRLIAKYEFGKLDKVKAQQLSFQLGFDTIITQPMTLAEIATQQYKSYTPKPREAIGFKRQENKMNEYHV